MPHPYGLESSQLSLPVDVVARHSADVDKNGRFPEESIASLGAAGLLGLTVSAELGGLGQGPRAKRIITLGAEPWPVVAPTPVSASAWPPRSWAARARRPR